MLKKTGTVILLVMVMLVCAFWTGTANVMGAECEHEVYCDDETTCIICGKEDLQEEEITKVVHPFAYCYDLATCGACEQPIEEGSAEEIRHNLEEQARFYPEGSRHRAECFCGEESEMQMHIVKCSQEDVCFLCGGEATDPQKIVKHENEHLFQDDDYHWRECTLCNKMTMPKLEHYTDCTDPDGPCGLCDRAHDECNFVEGKIGVHKLIHEVAGEGEERYHVATCIECDNVIMEHEGIVCNDFGSDDVHAVKCVKCDYAFDDEEHEYDKGVCVRCGRHESSCNHVVYCDEPNVCILCGIEDLIESEISEIRHPYAFCYDLSKCGACMEDIEEGSVSEIRHSLVNFVKYIPGEKGHWVSCACGKKVDEEIERHIKFCTEKDEPTCSLCGAKAEVLDYTHTNEQVFSDKEHHWIVCVDCGEQTSPLLDHYTLCTNPDGPCDYCEREHDECVFKDEFIGMHIDEHMISEEDGEFYHISICLECGKEIIRHKGLIYKDFGDAETHMVECKECGHIFNDEPHEYKNGVCTLCGRNQKSDPEPNKKSGTAPNTGDESHIMLWIYILVAALACNAFCVMRIRKKKI